MIRRISICICLLCCAAALPAAAQSLGAFKRQPAASSSLFGRARVIASEYGETAGKVADAARAEQRQRFAGYRVCIFSDNGPEAREGAFEAKKLFEETFSDVKVYMGYENPYFKVSGGNCLTAEEAIILKGRVSATFPKAFLKNEEIAVSDLVEP
jgi:hypothetical protein